MEVVVLVRVLHGIIVITLTLEALYAGFQVFFVLQPEGTSGPLLFSATEVSYELLIVRRLYALEAWLAFSALAIYLGITEVLPSRSLPRRRFLEALLPALEPEPAQRVDGRAPAEAGRAPQGNGAVPVRLEPGTALVLAEPEAGTAVVLADPEAGTAVVLAEPEAGTAVVLAKPEAGTAVVLAERGGAVDADAAQRTSQGGEEHPPTT